MPQLLPKKSRKAIGPRAIKTYPPADHNIKDPAYLREITDLELEAVMSAPGWSRRWKGSHEHNAEVRPYRCRGIGLSPGLYEAAARKDPVISSELDRRAKYLSSLDWRVTEPPDATPEEEAITSFVRDALFSIGPSGFAGLISAVSKRSQFGFSLFELVYEITEEGFWRAEEAVYIYPATCATWITDISGHLLGVLQKAERGLVAIPVQKLALFVRGFTGRNYEGISALRSCLWAAEYKADHLLTRAQSEALLSSAHLDVMTDAPAASAERNAIIAQLDQWGSAEQRYILHGEGTTITPSFGGSILPDLSPVKVMNHEIARALDGGLQELGVSEHGARAVGSEMRQASHQALAGEARELCYLLTSQLILPMLQLNGWDIRRTPTITVRGIGAVTRDDTDRARLMLEMIRDGVVPPDKIDAVSARAMELLDL